MSLLPKTGVCFSCGHDHGPRGGLPPDTERLLSWHSAEIKSKDERIAELEKANQELLMAMQDITNAATSMMRLLKLDKDHAKLLEAKNPEYIEIFGNWQKAIDNAGAICWRPAAANAGRVADDWLVSVHVNGSKVLEISDNHLSGVDDLEPHAATVECCAKQLLAVIGAPAVQEPARKEPTDEQIESAVLAVSELNGYDIKDQSMHDMVMAVAKSTIRYLELTNP